MRLRTQILLTTFALCVLVAPVGAMMCCLVDGCATDPEHATGAIAAHLTSDGAAEHAESAAQSLPSSHCAASEDQSPAEPTEISSGDSQEASAAGQATENAANSDAPRLAPADGGCCEPAAPRVDAATAPTVPSVAPAPSQSQLPTASLTASSGGVDCPRAAVSPERPSAFESTAKPPALYFAHRVLLI